MDKTAKKESIIQKLLLSCDYFTAGYAVMSLLFCVPYAVTSGGAVLVAFLALACLLPFVCMPLAYMLIHRASPLLFGRYHLVMPLSAFLSALFFVVMWSAADSSAGSACAVFFGATVCCFFALTHRYCAFSVRARLSEGTAGHVQYMRAFAFAGGCCCVGAVAGFASFDMSTALINSAYVLAGASTVLALAQYLATCHGIPRLDGRRVISLKSVFRSFYAGLEKRPFCSSALFDCAFAALGSCIVWIVTALGQSIYVAAGCGGALVCCYAVSEYACSRLVHRRSVALSAFNFCCFLLSAALLVTAAIARIGNGVLCAISVAGACAAGAGGGAAKKQKQMRLSSVKEGITGGVAHILGELMLCAGLALAAVAAATAAAVGNTAAIAIVPICGAVCAAAAFALTGKWGVRKQSLPEITYEPQTEGEDPLGRTDFLQ